MDLTDLPGLDNLRASSGCLAESQRLTAKLFGADNTYFLVNGSTVGIQAALLALNKPGEKVIVARNSHISVINGMVLSGGIPVLAPVEIESEWGFPLGITMKQLKSVLVSNYNASAVLLTNPEYRGTGIDIAQAIELIADLGIPLIVDEAHGAHLYFQEDVPLSAQRYSPDIVIHSAHKTLAALTQASILHINDKKWSAAIKSALDVLQTTSPSYLLMASLDGVQEQMWSKGKEMVGKVIEIAQQFRKEVAQLDGYRVYETDKNKGWYQDKTKVLVSAAELGLTGWELAAILLDRYGIAVEMSDYFYVLFLLHFGHEYEDVERTIAALTAIRQYKKEKTLQPLDRKEFIFDQNYQPIVSPRNIFNANKEIIPLKQAKERIAGEALVPYPPGVPLVWPGEILTKVHIEYFEEIKEQQIKVQGISANGMVSVIMKG
jgi:arginine/lysine/ornithine decarboxylase